ncbi:unnamed protein product [[Candida] boidinii]|nr:unnamed protein product [[Candida] boidinii]
MSGFRRVLGFVTKNQQDNDEKPIISAPVLTQSTKDLSSTQKPQPVPPQQQQQQQQPINRQSDALLQSQRISPFQQSNDKYKTPPTSNRNSQLNPDSPLPAIPGSAQSFNSPKTSQLIQVQKDTKNLNYINSLNHQWFQQTRKN